MGVIAYTLAATCAADGKSSALIAVAANFAHVMADLQPEFEKVSGAGLRISIGSTGRLYGQIINGAPFDVLLAADQVRAEKLENTRFGVPGSRFTYATGRLVLWSTQPDLLSGAEPALADLNFRHLAMANPDLAPYGAAARAVLLHLGVLEPITSRLVVAEDIGQAYTMVATRNAELGFIALSSLVNGNTRGSTWEVPQSYYPPIHQDAVLLSRAQENPAATAFLTWLRSDQARLIITQAGYLAP
ncbi:MAG: molybdate ABC transporter substrate-binding protein [Proteobacteria bacterium]|nr:molybdate ABC transporter substrate-binding protein [Pseudomonadota bacterium]